MKSKFLFVIVFSSLLVFSCKDNFSETTVSFNLGEASEQRSAFPESNFSEINYITITGESEGVTKRIGTWNSYEELLSARMPISLGTWDFNIVLLSPSEKYTGSVSDIEIKEGENNSVSFKVTIDDYTFENKGKFELTFEYPELTYARYAKVAIYNYTNNALAVQEKMISAVETDDKLKLFITEELNSGSYNVLTTFYADRSYTQLLATNNQLLYITENKNTSRVINLSTDDFVDVYTITFDLNQTELKDKDGNSTGINTVPGYKDGYLPPDTYIYSTGIALPKGTELTRQNAMFRGWYESPDPSASAVAIEEIVPKSKRENKTYYAKWVYDALPKEAVIDNASFAQPEFRKLEASFTYPDIVADSEDDDIKTILIGFASTTNPEICYELSVDWKARREEINYTDTNEKRNYSYEYDSVKGKAHFVIDNIEALQNYKAYVKLQDEAYQTSEVFSNKDIRVADWFQGNFGTDDSDCIFIIDAVNLTNYFKFKNVVEAGTIVDNSDRKMEIVWENTVYNTDKAPVSGWKEGYSKQGSYTSKSWAPDDIKDILFAPGNEISIPAYDFLIYEIPNQLYSIVMDTTYEGKGLAPAIVSWIDAVTFCNRLSERMGYAPCYTISEESVFCDYSKNGFRLPSEAEWEYAVRGGKDSKGWANSRIIENQTLYSIIQQWTTEEPTTSTPGYLAEEQANLAQYYAGNITRDQYLSNSLQIKIKYGARHYIESKQEYYNPPTNLDKYAVIKDSPLPIGSKLPMNGIYDSLGNASEWCFADYYDAGKNLGLSSSVSGNHRIKGGQAGINTDSNKYFAPGIRPTSDGKSGIRLVRNAAGN